MEIKNKKEINYERNKMNSQEAKIKRLEKKIEKLNDEIREKDDKITRLTSSLYREMEWKRCFQRLIKEMSFEDTVEPNHYL